jgi:hypothetical protein
MLWLVFSKNRLKNSIIKNRGGVSFTLKSRGAVLLQNSRKGGWYEENNGNVGRFAGGGLHDG